MSVIIHRRHLSQMKIPGCFKYFYTNYIFLICLDFYFM